MHRPNEPGEEATAPGDAAMFVHLLTEIVGGQHCAQLEERVREHTGSSQYRTEYGVRTLKHKVFMSLNCLEVSAI